MISKKGSNGKNLSRIRAEYWRRKTRELTEFCSKVSEFCEKRGEFAVVHHLPRKLGNGSRILFREYCTGKRELTEFSLQQSQ